MGTAMAKTGKLPPVESEVPKSPSASLRNTTSPGLRQSALKRESCCSHALARGASPVPARQWKPCESRPAITTSLAHAAVHTSCATVASSGSISGSSVPLISVLVSDVISDVSCGIARLYRILWQVESDAPGWRLRPYFADCRLHGSYPETTFEEGIEANRHGTWTINAASSTGRCNTI